MEAEANFLSAQNRFPPTAIHQRQSLLVIRLIVSIIISLPRDSTTTDVERAVAPICSRRIILKVPLYYKTIPSNYAALRS